MCVDIIIIIGETFLINDFLHSLRRIPSDSLFIAQCAPLGADFFSSRIQSMRPCQRSESIASTRFFAIFTHSTAKFSQSHSPRV